MVRLQVRFARAHMQPTKPTKKKKKEKKKDKESKIIEN